jgi:hypothetical protein
MLRSPQELEMCRFSQSGGTSWPLLDHSDHGHCWKQEDQRRLPKRAKVSFKFSSVKSSGMRNTNKLAPGGPCNYHTKHEQGRLSNWVWGWIYSWYWSHPRLLKRHQLNFFIYGFNIKLTTQPVFSNIGKEWVYVNWGQEFKVKIGKVDIYNFK